MNLGVIFPGQGAQFSGMGRDFVDRFPAARETFAEADDALGFSLSDACWKDGDDVHRTDIAQPGILTTSVAILRALEAERGVQRGSGSFTAGLSLGEYTALFWCGALEFADAVKLVRLRGQAMQDASEATPSSMVSLMGATLEQAQALAAIGSRAGICQVANRNAPGQIVISGELAALDAAEAAAKDEGVRRTRRLVVAGGFHSECMRPAAERLAEALASVTIQRPSLPFLSNVTGGPVEDPEEIRTRLAEQVCSSVLWEDSMRWALAQGHRRFLEPGPGEILAGILRKIDREAEVVGVPTPEALEAFERAAGASNT